MERPTLSEPTISQSHSGFIWPDTIEGRVDTSTLDELDVGEGNK
jgi:hypothetical protein